MYLYGICFALLASKTVLVQSSDIEDLSGEKLILKPAELVDLILDDSSRKDPITLQQRDDHELNNIKEYNFHTTLSSTMEYIDNLLRNRKVWSRWSKWDHCSVSCGEGVMSRHRLCVAGRCASGEREVQRQPCHRATCTSYAVADLD